MRLRERRREDPPAGGNGSPNPDAGANLERLRQAAQGFLDAGSDAINQALSQNSEAFLEANRQQGGQ